MFILISYYMYLYLTISFMKSLVCCSQRAILRYRDDTDLQLIHVYKTILRIRCQFFRNMFYYDWLVNGQRLVFPKKINYIFIQASFLISLFYCILTHIYVSNSIVSLILLYVYAQSVLLY